MWRVPSFSMRLNSPAASGAASCRCVCGQGRKLDWPGARNQAGRSAFVVIQPQSREIFFAKRKINVLAQIAFQRRSWQIEFDGSRLGDFLDSVEPVLLGCLKISD